MSDATARGAWIRAVVDSRDGLLTFSAPNLPLDDVRIEVDVGRLKLARDEIASTLEAFMAVVTDRLRPDRSDVERALREFVYQTFAIGTVALGGSAGMARIRELLDFPRGWWRDPRAPVPVLQVEGNDHNFPFELLPLFDHSRVGSLDTAAALVEAARRFLCFTAVVRRVPPGGLAQPRNLQGDPLHISLMRHGGLGGSAYERRSLAKLARHLEIDGPWPDNGTDDEAVIREVAGALFDDRHRLSVDGDWATQIHHFACHCDTTQALLSRSALVLAGDDGVDRSVPLYRIFSEAGALRQGLAERGQPLPSDERPLVFLNACGSGFVDPARMTFFPQSLLDEKHLGVIAVETVVPDALAGRYAAAFYRLLLAGRPLGVALVKARLFVLGQYGNPLGMLYALYANPDVKVQPHVPDEAIGDSCLDV